MNKIFRVIWNHALQTWVAVSELAKGKVKSSNGQGSGVEINRSHSQWWVIGSISLLLSLSSQNVEAAFAFGGSIATSGDGQSGFRGFSDYGTPGYVGITIVPRLNTSESTESSLNTEGLSLGRLSKANAVFGTAVGVNTQAKGVGSVALGLSAHASSASSIAIGVGALSSGLNSLAIQRQAVASADFATAIGAAAAVSSNSGVGIGKSVLVTGKRAIAIGSSTNDAGNYDKDTNAQATEDDSIALGTTARATSAKGIAIGREASVSAEGGVALGEGSVAETASGEEGYDPSTNAVSTVTTGGAWSSTKGAVSVGTANGTVTRQIKGVAAGSNDTDAVNLAQLKKVTLKVSGDSGSGSVALNSQTLKIDGKDGIVSEATGQTVIVKLDPTTKGKIDGALSKTEAASTYLTKTDASTTYLTKTDASTTYATKTDLSGKAAGSNTFKFKIQDGSAAATDAKTWTLSTASDTVTFKAGDNLDVSAANGVITYSLDNATKTSINSIANKVNTSDFDTYKTSVTNSLNSVNTALNNKANISLDNINDAGKAKITGLVNATGNNGITVSANTDNTSKIKTFTVGLDTTTRDTLAKVGAGSVAQNDNKTVTGNAVYNAITGAKTTVSAAAGQDVITVTPTTSSTGITANSYTVGINTTKLADAVKTKAEGDITSTDLTVTNGDNRLLGTDNVIISLKDTDKQAIAAVAGKLNSSDFNETNVTNKVTKGSLTSTSLTVGGTGKVVGSNISVELNQDTKNTLAKVGTGTVAADNKNTVTGGSVYTAITGAKTVVEKATNETLLTVNKTPGTGTAADKYTLSLNKDALKTEVGNHFANKDLSNISATGQNTIKGLTKVAGLGSISVDTGTEGNAQKFTVKLSQNAENAIADVANKVSNTEFNTYKGTVTTELAKKVNQTDYANATGINVNKWKERIDTNSVEVVEADANSGITVTTAERTDNVKGKRYTLTLNAGKIQNLAGTDTKGDITSSDLKVTGGTDKVFGSDVTIDLKQETKEKIASIDSKVGTNVFDEYKTTVNTALGNKANTDLSNLTEAGNTVIKNQAKAAINVVGGDSRVTVNKDERVAAGVDTYKVSVDVSDLATKTEVGAKLDASAFTNENVTSKVNTGTVSSTTLDISGTGKVVGSDLTVNLKNGAVDTAHLSTAVQNSITNAKTKVAVNPASGGILELKTSTEADQPTTYTLSINETKLKDVTGTTNLATEYAKADASNINGNNLTNWKTKLNEGASLSNPTGALVKDSDLTSDALTGRISKGNVVSGSTSLLSVTGGEGKVFGSDVTISLTQDATDKINNALSETKAAETYARKDATGLSEENKTAWKTALGVSNLDLNYKAGNESTAKTTTLSQGLHFKGEGLTITTAANGVVDFAITDNAITKAKLADNAVGTDEIEAKAVTKAKLADDVTNEIADKADKRLSNLEDAGKAVVTGLVAATGEDGITVDAKVDDTSKVKTFTVGLDDTTKGKIAKIAAGEVATSDENTVTGAKVHTAITGAKTKVKLADGSATSLTLNKTESTDLTANEYTLKLDKEALKTELGVANLDLYYQGNAGETKQNTTLSNGLKFTSDDLTVTANTGGEVNFTLKNDAVETANIKDGAVTKAKLAEEVKTEIANAKTRVAVDPVSGGILKLDTSTDTTQPTTYTLSIDEAKLKEKTGTTNLATEYAKADASNIDNHISAWKTKLGVSDLTATNLSYKGNEASATTKTTSLATGLTFASEDLTITAGDNGALNFALKAGAVDESNLESTLATKINNKVDNTRKLTFNTQNSADTTKTSAGEWTLSSDDNVNFKAGDGLKVSGAGKEITYDLSDTTKDTLARVGTGSVVDNDNNTVTGNTVFDAIEAAKNSLTTGGMTFAGDVQNNKTSKVSLGSTLTVEGEGTEPTTTAANNIAVEADGSNKLTVKLAENLSNIKTIHLKGQNGKDGKIGVDADGNVTVTNGINGTDGTGGEASKIVTEKTIGNQTIAYRANEGTADADKEKTVKLSKGFTFKGDANVKAGIGSDGAVTYSLNPALTGITSITGDGTTATFGSNGITLNSKKITGLTDGATTSSSTDAVTGAQLYGVANNVKGILGSSIAIDANGGLTATNIGNSSKNNVHEAIAASREEVAITGDVLTLTPSKTSDGANKYTLGINATKLNDTAILKYKANGDGTAAAKETALSTGLEFASQDTDQLAITTENSGKVKFDLLTGAINVDTATKAISVTAADNNKLTTAKNVADAINAAKSSLTASGFDVSATAAETTGDNKVTHQLTKELAIVGKDSNLATTVAQDGNGKTTVKVGLNSTLTNMSSIGFGQGADSTVITKDGLTVTEGSQVLNITSDSINGLADRADPTAEDYGVSSDRAKNKTRAATEGAVKAVSDALSTLKNSSEAATFGLEAQNAAENNTEKKVTRTLNNVIKLQGGNSNINTQVATDGININLNPELTGITSIAGASGAGKLSFEANNVINANSGKITNVASGRKSATEAEGSDNTNAANIQDVREISAWTIKGNGGNAVAKNSDTVLTDVTKVNSSSNEVDFVDGTFTTTKVKQTDKGYAVSVNVTEGTVTLPTTTPTTLDEIKVDTGKEGVATVNTVVSTVKKAADILTEKGVNFEGETTGDAVARKLGETLKLQGGATGELSSNNIAVKKNAANNGYDIKLAQTLTGLTSATFGTDNDKTVINKDGLTVKGANDSTLVSLTDNAGTPTLEFAKTDSKGTGVITGLKDLDASETDGSKAANKNYVDSQVKGLTDSGINVGADEGATQIHKLGKEVEFVKAGTNGITVGTGESAVKYSGDNLITKVSQDANGKTTVEIGLKEKLALKELTVDDAAKDGKVEIKDGTQGGSIKLTGVTPAAPANGTADPAPTAEISVVGNKAAGSNQGLDTTNKIDSRISYNDGDSEHKLATLDDGLTFSGDDNQDVTRKLGTELTIKGGKSTDLTENNIGVVKATSADGLVVKLAKELTALTSATFGSGDNSAVLNADSLTFKAKGDTADAIVKTLTISNDKTKGGSITGLEDRTVVNSPTDYGIAGRAATESAVKEVSDRVNKAADGTTGVVVYTDQDGKRIVKDNGQFYLTKADGTADKTNPAVPADKVLVSIVNPDNLSDKQAVGNASKLSNLAKASITSTSTEAINGAQLNNLNQYLGLELNTNKTGFKAPELVALEGSDSTPMTVVDALNRASTKLNEGITLVGNNYVNGLKSTEINKNLGEKFEIVGGYTGTDVSSNNLKTAVKNNKLEIQMTEKPTFTEVTATDKVTVGTGTSKVELGAESVAFAKNGTNGTGVITGLKDLEASETDGSKAANKNYVDSQVKGLTDSGINVGADEGTTQTHKLGKELEIVKAANEITVGEVKYSGDNLITKVSQDATTGKTTVEIGLKEKLALKELTVDDTAEKGKVKLAEDAITVVNKDSKDAVSVTTDAEGDGKVVVNNKAGESAVEVGHNDKGGLIKLTGVKSAEDTAAPTATLSVIASDTNKGLDNAGVDSRISYNDGNTEHKLATLDDGLVFQGDETAEDKKVSRKLGETLTIKGGATDTSDSKLTSGNIAVVKDTTAGANGLVVKLAKDLKELSSVQVGDKDNGVTITPEGTVTKVTGKDGSVTEATTTAQGTGIVEKNSAGDVVRTANYELDKMELVAGDKSVNTTVDGTVVSDGTNVAAYGAESSAFTDGTNEAVYGKSGSTVTDGTSTTETKADGIKVTSNDEDDKSESTYGKDGLTVKGADGKDAISLTNKAGENGAAATPTLEFAKDATKASGKDGTGVITGLKDLDPLDVDGSKAANKNYVDSRLSDLDAGKPFEYFDKDGNKVVRGKDNKFYKETDIKGKVYVEGKGYVSPKDKGEENAEVVKEVASDNVVIKAMPHDGQPMVLSNIRSGLGLSPIMETKDNQTVEKAITKEAAQTVVGSLVTQTGAGLNNAATVRDLQALAQAGLDFTGNNDTVTVHRELGTKLTLEGETSSDTPAKDWTKVGSAADNIYVEADSKNNKLVVKLSKELENLNSAKFGTAENGVTITPEGTVTKVTGKDGSVTEATTTAQGTGIVEKNSAGDVVRTANYELDKMELVAGDKSVNTTVDGTVVSDGTNVAAYGAESSAFTDGTNEAVYGKSGSTVTDGTSTTETKADGIKVTSNDKDDKSEATYGKDGLTVKGADGKDAISLTNKAGENGAAATPTLEFAKDATKASGKDGTGVITGLKDLDPLDVDGSKAANKNYVDSRLSDLDAGKPFEYFDKDGNKVVRGKDNKFYKETDIKGKVYVEGKGYVSPEDKGEENAEVVKEVASDNVVIKAMPHDGQPMALSNIRSGLGLSPIMETKDNQTVEKAITKEVAQTAVGSLVTQTGAGLNNAATVRDLQALAQAGLDFAGDSGSDIHRTLGAKLSIKGGETGTAKLTALSDKNIGVVTNGDVLEVRLAKNLKGLESVTVGEDGNGAQITKDGVLVNDGTNIADYSAGKAVFTDGVNEASYGKSGLDVTDGTTTVGITSSGMNITSNDEADKSGATYGKDGMLFKDDAGNQAVKLTATPNTLSLSGSSQPVLNKDNQVVGTHTNVKITGVADGDITPTSNDAVNGSQIYALTGGNQVSYNEKGETVTTAKDEKGNTIIDSKTGKPKEYSLTTYDVSGQTEFTTNSTITAIHNMNEQGIKFFHTNDGKVVKKGNGDTEEDSSAAGKYATAIGVMAEADGKQSLAIGHGAVAKGDKSIAMGTGNQVIANKSGAFGDPNIIMGKDVENIAVSGSYAIGNDNIINSSNTFVLGNNINRTVTKDENGNSVNTAIGNTVENSVYLGNNTTAKGGDGSATGTLKNLKQDGTAGDTTTAGSKGTVSTATVKGVTYGGFAGATADGVVSVGAAGKERRIQNVAAGEISETSTDAINGSQLHSVAKTLTTGINNMANNINSNFNQMNKRIDKVDRELRSGVASAIAMGTLVQAYNPSDSILSVGTGTYRGGSALAVGYSKVSDSGKVILKFSGSVNNAGDVAGGASVGFKF